MPRTAPTGPFSPGQEVDKYRIEKLLGAGGMGFVYEATHIGLKKRVAIKTLKPHWAEDETIRRRFLQEGELAARIRHPGVVDVTDVGVVDDTPFLVMEFLQGVSLSARIDDGALAITEAVFVIMGACVAVAAAHDAGVLHRDIKPSNIFLEETGRGVVMPKVVDFGISKSMEPGPGPKLTDSAVTVGTPHYMAPEQLSSSNSLTGAVDQYALGATLYECLTRKNPYDNLPVMEALLKKSTGTVPSMRDIAPDIPEELEAVVLEAMAAKPEDRYADMRAFGRALLPFASEMARSRYAIEFMSTGRSVPPPVTEPYFDRGVKAPTPVTVSGRRERANTPETLAAHSTGSRSMKKRENRWALSVGVSLALGGVVFGALQAHRSTEIASPVMPSTTAAAARSTERNEPVPAAPSAASAASVVEASAPAPSASAATATPSSASEPVASAPTVVPARRAPSAPSSGARAALRATHGGLWPSPTRALRPRQPPRPRRRRRLVTWLFSEPSA